MTDRFHDCLKFTLSWEGGDSNDSRDPGGATRNGITQRTYDAWRKQNGRVTQSVFKMAGLERDTIYLGEYWNPLQCGRLDAGVDLVVFDAGVNSGTSRARQWLMASIGGSSITTIKCICAKRLSFLEGLRTYPVFGKGWRSRVTAGEAEALKTAAGTNASNVLATEARTAKSKSVTAKTSAKATPIAGVGAETLHQTAGGGHGWLTIALAVTVTIAVVVLIVRSKLQAERANALAQAADAAKTEASAHA